VSALQKTPSMICECPANHHLSRQRFALSRKLNLRPSAGLEPTNFGKLARALILAGAKGSPRHAVLLMAKQLVFN